MAKKIGVILSGCGVYDGAEIHESVITLLAIDRHGAEAVCMAPNITADARGQPPDRRSGRRETRNVLVESARIARGKIRDLATVTAAELDALILPGGFGAAKNLCDFAVNGPDCSVNPEVARLVRQMDAAKPVAAVCIAPALLASVLGGQAPDADHRHRRRHRRRSRAMGASTSPARSASSWSTRPQARLHPGLHAGRTNLRSGGRHRADGGEAPGDGVGEIPRRSFVAPRDDRICGCAPSRLRVLFGRVGAYNRRVDPTPSPGPPAGARRPGSGPPAPGTWWWSAAASPAPGSCRSPPVRGMGCCSSSRGTSPPAPPPAPPSWSTAACATSSRRASA